MKPLSKSLSMSKYPLTHGCKQFLVLLVVAFGTCVLAGEGHDHGEAKTPAAAASASPRFQGHSDLFEVVGILKGDELSITIDRYATNEPVLDAKVEVESGALKKTAAFHADHGDYSLPAESFRKPGTYPITLTIVSGKDTDLVVGDLVVPDPQAGHDQPAQAASGILKWVKPAGAAALSLVIVGIAASIWRRRRVRV